MGKDYQKYVFTFASNYVSIHASNSLPPITKVMANDRTESRIFKEIRDWLITDRLTYPRYVELGPPAGPKQVRTSFSF